METLSQTFENQEYDVIEKIKELYDMLDGSLSTEKLILIKPFIKEFSDECKKFNIFTDAKLLYDDFIIELDKIENPDQKIIAAWNHLDGKLAVAASFLHFKASIVLVIPLLNYTLEKYVVKS